MSVLKATTDIITNITARPMVLTETLAIMSVSTFKIVVILYGSDRTSTDTSDNVCSKLKILFYW
jgi:hypothetical protein